MTDQAMTSTRPRWSAAEAARRCNVGRATIQRALDGGKLPGAVKTEDGWQIPLEDLLAAGFKPDRPAPPEDAPAKAEAARGSDKPEVPELAKLEGRVKELETELLSIKSRAESEAALRAAAEILAQERLDRVSDLRTALRMLEAAKPVGTSDAAAPAASPAAGTQQRSRPPRRRTLREWWDDRRHEPPAGNGAATSRIVVEDQA
ncbi:helix-turn-helix domain-containing protein [Hoyosella sp. G463]|uniref:Helix-turn-helix domain-containing protein n=1 Tax=Lolliginicoccus lacisalsi TaxID=2742202 RepID=A0A927JCW8_9ACTN|nr:helix-turn-helix domain-containing protein [Lolliginicoccus lacisalsi]MBD8507008.1 helix-turn-helix domain-containing protein [Lolliginicoccus lacisalsi]